MEKAVLFLIFNRPDTAQKVFEQIKAAKPPRFYLASDGARVDKPGEKQAVEDLRKWVLDNIDWDCEVKTLFRDGNLGCGRAVSSAVSWFFENESDGIILEDDCLPSQSFFKYCEELLDYYKDDKRVWHISGTQFLDDFNSDASYYFAKIQHCWGWASWADRWQYYDFDLTNYPQEDIRNFSSNKYIQKYWLNVLRKMQNHEIDTWDYQWTFKIVENNGFCINPAKNLIANIGFDGTHYSNSLSNSRLNIQTYELEKIIHPDEIKFDKKAVDLIYEKVFDIKRPDLKNVLLYIKKYPFFFLRKKFYDMLV